MGKDAVVGKPYTLQDAGAISPTQCAQNIITYVAETAKGSSHAGVMVDTSKGAPYAVIPW